jgi:hypothetical protein
MIREEGPFLICSFKGSPSIYDDLVEDVCTVCGAAVERRPTPPAPNCRPCCPKCAIILAKEGCLGELKISQRRKEEIIKKLEEDGIPNGSAKVDRWISEISRVIGLMREK